MFVVNNQVRLGHRNMMPFRPLTSTTSYTFLYFSSSALMLLPTPARPDTADGGREKTHLTNVTPKTTLVAQLLTNIEEAHTQHTIVRDPIRHVHIT